MDVITAGLAGLWAIAKALVIINGAFFLIVFAIGSFALSIEKSRQRYRQREAVKVVHAKEGECGMCFEPILVTRKYCQPCIAAQADVRWLLHQGGEEQP